MLTITHTREAGTLIDGTERGDGTNVVLKAHRWRFSRNLGTWYVPQSRDRAAKVRTIETTAAALREAGYDVQVTIDDTARAAAVVEADKIARQAARADALAAKADRKAGAADAAYARHEAAVERLPEGGEPIKVGHHSEKRHRRDTERAWSTLGTAVHAQRDADAAQQAAATAAATTGARYNPVTVGNRIDRLAAQIRKYERELVAPVYAPTRDIGPRPSASRRGAVAASNRRSLRPATISRTGRACAPSRSRTAPSPTTGRTTSPRATRSRSATGGAASPASTPSP